MNLISQRNKDLSEMKLKEEKENILNLKNENELMKNERIKLERSYKEIQNILESTNKELIPLKEELNNLNNKIFNTNKIKDEKYEEWIKQNVFLFEYIQRNVKEYKNTIIQLKQDIILIKKIINETVNEAQGKSN